MGFQQKSKSSVLGQIIASNLTNVLTLSDCINNARLHETRKNKQTSNASLIPRRSLLIRCPREVSLGDVTTHGRVQE